METRVESRLIGQPGNYKVVVYGLDQYYCSNCSREFQNKDYVYTCEGTYTSTNCEDEYRVLNCDRCERNKATACINARYDSIAEYHIHCLAILRMCPKSIDVEDFMRELVQ